MPRYYEKFARLSQQEHNWGLLDDLAAIGNQRGWRRTLEAYCAELRGYRVVWRKDADPYQIKLIQANPNRKQKEPKIHDLDRFFSSPVPNTPL